MSKNGIAWLPTKEARQLAKLQLAETKRQATGTAGYRALRYLDTTELPTVYSGNDVVNNPNIGGLVQGRPWKTTPNTTLGLWRSFYNGYFGNYEDPDYWHWFNTQTPFNVNVATDFSVDLITVNGNVTENTSVEWLGYFKAPHTANYTFYIYSDDTGILWIGDKAITEYGDDNWDVYGDAGSGETFSDPIALVAGQYYPIRVQYGNATGNGYFNISWEDDYVGPMPTYELVDPLGANHDGQSTGVVDIIVHSSSYNAIPVTNGTITVNGLTAVNTNGSRGHTVLFMASNGAILGSNTYDTYGNPSDIASMNNDLVLNPSGSIIAICSYDATSLDSSLRATLNTYYGGTATDTWSSQRVTHIFIGQRV